MEAAPFFSICIPVYKNVAYLGRLLNSILEQSFTNYEVVITDDSPDDSVERYVVSHYNDNRIRFIRNAKPLGTPENWNEGIRQARGSWIKLMHDDDWFATPDALRAFHDAVIQVPGCRFFFAAYRNVSETGGEEVVRMSWLDKKMLSANELHLFSKVYVGNPSCTLVHRDVPLLYDARYKFVVDFEYYIRLIRHTGSWHYMDEVLLNVGFNENQVTVYTKYNPAVQVPENHNLVRQLGEGILNNILVFDYYWRMYRNVGVRSLEQALQHDPAPVPPRLAHMIRIQSAIPVALLRIGICSKICMTVCYLLQRMGFR